MGDQRAGLTESLELVSLDGWLVAVVAIRAGPA